MRKYFSILLLTSICTQNSYTDSLVFNTFNNYGSVGLINMPTARFYDESSYGITIYSGNPDKKITMTSFPLILAIKSCFKIMKLSLANI